MTRIIFGLCILFEEVLEIKYVLYLAALLYGVFIANYLNEIQVKYANAILGSMIIILGNSIIL